MKLLILGVIFSLSTTFLPNPPVGDGTISRGFEPPKSRFGSGHRGIDLSAASLDLVYSPISGNIHFSGYVVDRPVVSIVAGKILMTFEPVDGWFPRGAVIRRGDIIGTVGTGGHCDANCVHIGVRVFNTREYLDPMPYLLQLPRLLAAKP